MKKLLLTLLFGASCMLPASAAKYMTLVFPMAANRACC